jgi:hypothetical protein
MSSISKSGLTPSCRTVVLRVKSRLVLEHDFSACCRRATTDTSSTVYRQVALTKNKKYTNDKNKKMNTTQATYICWQHYISHPRS